MNTPAIKITIENGQKLIGKNFFKRSNGCEDLAGKITQMITDQFTTWLVGIDEATRAEVKIYSINEGGYYGTFITN